MEPITILQHEPDSPPGSIVDALDDLGVPYEVRQLDKGDRLPAWPDETAGVISLGGHMQARHIREFPFLEAEIKLLRGIIHKGGPVWGIDLGAQLLTLAGGGSVYQRRKPEIGWVSIEKAVDDELLRGLSSPFVAFCWHSHSCKLSPTAHLTAEVHDEVQAFRAGGRAWATQFHPEIDASMATRWIDAAVKKHPDLEPDFVRALRERTEEMLPAYPAFCRKLTGNFIAMSGLLPAE